MLTPDFARRFLAEVYPSPVAAPAIGCAKPSPEGAGTDGWTLDLAGVVACQHLGRDMQRGTHEHGFDLLAGLLVTRLGGGAPSDSPERAADAVVERAPATGGA